MKGMMENTFAVIMAGGSGTRLWPVSRKDHPKHTLSLLGEGTLFQNTVDRISGFWSSDRIFVVTSREHAGLLQQQAPSIPQENFLLEPQPRGTASVVGLAATAIARRDPDAIFVVLPADHFIGNIDLFKHVLRVGIDVAKNDYLVTLGIAPTYPAVGYGYIQRGALLPEKFDYPVYHVIRFKEKPAEVDALKMLRGGDHSWNSGMFIWKVQSILTEIHRQMPDLFSLLEMLAAAKQGKDVDTILDMNWHDLKTETIDYGIMENASRVAVLPASGLGWSDIGNWDSLFDVLLPDENGNIIFNGKHKGIDTYGSLIYGAGDKRLIVTIGVDDFIVVDNHDVLLICRKDQTQKVREIVGLLKKENHQSYL